MVHNKIYLKALKESKETIENRIKHEYFLREKPDIRRFSENLPALTDNKIDYIRKNWDNLAKIIYDFSLDNFEMLENSTSSVKKLFSKMVDNVSFCFVYGQIPNNFSKSRSSLKLAKTLAKIYTENFEFFKNDFTRKDTPHPLEVEAVSRFGHLFFRSADSSLIDSFIDIYRAFYKDTFVIKYAYDQILDYLTSPYYKKIYENPQRVKELIQDVTNLLIKNKNAFNLQESKLKYFMIDRVFGFVSEACFEKEGLEKEKLIKLSDIEFEILDVFKNSKYNDMDLDLEKIEKDRMYQDFLKREIPNHKLCYFFPLICKGSHGIEEFSRKQKALNLLRNEDCESIEEIIELCHLKIPGYSIKKRLGIGTYKKVYLGRNVISDALKAVSIFDISERGKINLDKKEISLLDMIKNETRKAEILKNLGNSHIINIEEISHDERSKNYILITELMDKTLKDELEENGGRLSEKKVLSHLGQILDGLYALHKKGLIHSDITLENIGIKEGNLKLMDFGLISTISQFDEHKMNTGSIDTRAPELFEGKKATTQSDMWSLGCVTYKLLTGNYPFLPDIQKPKEPGEEREIYEKNVYHLIKSKNINEILKSLGVSKKTKGLLQGCLEKNPKRRLKDASKLKWALNRK